MMNLIPWRGRNDLTSFRSELDDLFGRFFESDLASHLPAVFRRDGMPPVDVAETEKDWRISIQLPGMSEKDIQVQLLGRQLVVSGERKWEEQKKGKEYHRVESQYGAFERSLVLPEDSRLDPDAIDATYKKGILTVRIPKVEPTPAKKIAVKGEN